MSRLSVRFSPVNGYDIPGLESWLERQAARGLLFGMTAGPLVLFERQQPAVLRFHLGPGPRKRRVLKTMEGHILQKGFLTARFP